MKKIYLVVFLFITVAATAQNRKHPWGVGVDLNVREYNGDLGDGFLKFNDFMERYKETLHSCGIENPVLQTTAI